MGEWSRGRTLPHCFEGLTVRASIRVCHLSEGGNRSQMLFYFWQLHPATPGESKTVSRPPERFSALEVLSASLSFGSPSSWSYLFYFHREKPEAHPCQVGPALLTEEELIDLQNLLDSQESPSLTGIVPAVSGEMSGWQLESLFVFTHF